MDTSIRTLLSSAQSYKGVEKNPFLQQAYMQMKNVTEAHPAVDTPEPFGQDLLVLAAEIAFQNGLCDIAWDCLKMYFLKQQPSNQFLIRAYLCQAQLHTTHDANNLEQLNKAVVFLLKAVSLAKQTERYHFLVYNASVLFWQFCRPFLKSNFRQYLAQSLHQVVKALDDIEDKDHEWRAQLMIALVECHLDAGRKTDASVIAAAAATFIKQNVPHLYKQIFGLMVQNQLMESAKLHKDIKASPELSVFYKICKIKSSVERDEPGEYFTEVCAILTQLGVAQSMLTIPQVTELQPRKEVKSLSGRSSPSVVSSSPSGEDAARKTPPKTARRIPTPTSSKKIAADSADRPFLLLELCHLCLDLGFADLASICMECMKTCNVKEQGFYLQLEFLHCLLMVKRLGEKEESYQKPIVELRLQAIRRCEEAIMNSLRFGDPNVIQAGCVTQWNLCLPLIQPNLRHHIRKPLTLIAEALENIQSLLVQLRCQVYTELAKCEEDMEQIEVAMEHLKKALQMDDGNVYQERLEVMLRRLELRSQLYRQPERPEDQAAMIIEQARKADSGTIRMKRSLLVKAGEALAPYAFLLVLDSESDTKVEASGRGPLTIVKQLCAKARAFNRCVCKAEGHIRRFGNENDRERAHLWADLAKTARKQEVWDVCRVAARFCLLYDDGRWKNVVSKPSTPKRSRGELKEENEEKKSGSNFGVSGLTSEETLSLYDRDLIRLLAEVNFINGEALIHLLRSEGVQLNDKPVPPKTSSKHPKGYIPQNPEEDPEWIEYCNWIKELSDASTKSFLRGMELGVELAEAWLVCSAAAYIWNYNNHILSSGRHDELVPALTSLLGALKTTGHAGETILLVNICKALAQGLLAPWIPHPSKEDKTEAGPASTEDVSTKGSKASKKSKPLPAANKHGFTISSESGPDIKKAVEVCEFAIALTSGDNPQDIVPIAVRQQLLQMWVMSKQMAQQQISKSLGIEDDTTTDGQKPMSRAIVATEMLSLNKNGIMEFRETPAISDVVQMVEKCRWSDSFVELQLWTCLTFLAFETGTLHGLVLKCSNKALQFAGFGTQPRPHNKDNLYAKHVHMVEQEMLSYASVLQGQSLINNMAGKNTMRREALEAFLNSCRFARAANNYELVMTAARHYWNAAVPLVSQPIERELLREPIKIILDCITATMDKKIKEEPHTKEKPPPAVPKAKEDAKEEDSVGINKSVAHSEPEESAGMIGDRGEDLTLRAALYGVLFQSYADQGEWELALQAIDQAITDMPRTKHRLLIFKHRVMVKAKLGHGFHSDIQKFKDESEENVAHMWRRIALSSRELSEQLSSYQNAIEALTSANNEFQKVEYLLEFGQWLYFNEFPLQDVLDQVEWAVDILLNMQNEETSLSKDGVIKGSSLSMESKRSSKAGKRFESKRSKQSAQPRTSRVKSPGPEELDKKLAQVKSEPNIQIVNYIPVVKTTVIGVLPNNPSLTVSDLWDIRQLDALVRSHVLLAELTGRDGVCYADILLQAYGYLMQMWKALMSDVGHAIKEIAKNQAASAEIPPKGKSPSKGKAGKEKEVVHVKERPKQKGPLDVLPDVIEDWAVYEAPDEVVEALQDVSMKRTGLNENTMPKPMLTMHYLDSLIKQLKDFGYTHLALPVLAMEDLLSRSLLKNDALKVLVHIRALQVCYELDLKAGCEFHEGIAEQFHIHEKDQALSRQEIALWKEKQVQVAREEMRLKEILAVMAVEPTKQKPSTSGQQTSKTVEEQPVMSHMGVTLGAVSLRVVWTDTAEVLINLGYLQRAREFLNEANMSAEAFSDNPLRARIMLLFGRLSFEEAQYCQAINFCKEVQEICEGDEIFWFETTQLLVDSVLLDYSNKRRRHHAKHLLVHALNEFQKITNDRPNHAATLGFIMTVLEARLADIQLQSVLEHHNDINSPKVMKVVLSVCEKIDDAAEKLVRLGYRREAVPLVMKHATLLADLARAATEVNVQHAYYLEALGVLGEAESLAQQLFIDVQTLNSLSELRRVSLPVKRELCNVLLTRGELLVEVMKVQVKEMGAMQLAEERKKSIQRLVEDYIRQTPTYSSTQSVWLKKRMMVFEEAIVALLSALDLAGNMSELRVRSLVYLSKCLRILAEHKSPDPPLQWLVYEMEMLKVHSEAEEIADKAKDGLPDEGEEKIDEEENQTEISDEGQKQFLKQTTAATLHADQHEQSKLYYTYATECLTQGLNLALACKHTELAGIAALELVECCGQFDASAATQFLALYQSCRTSSCLKELLYQAQKDPMTSRLASLLHQQHSLLRSHLSTNLVCSKLFTSITENLDKDWQAWKLLDVFPNHLDLLKEFPQNFNFVILQHSSEKDFLYGAVLEKPKPIGSEKGKGNPRVIAASKTAESSGSRARIFGKETSPSLLQEIQNKFRRHKQTVQAFLLKQEYQSTQAAQRQKMMENLGDSKIQLKILTEDTMVEEQMLQEEFRELVVAMENYLKPIITSVGTALRSNFSPMVSINNLAKDSPKEIGQYGHECVILLADTDLLELPLEALSCLQVDEISALSRDFSLQFLYHRIHQGMESDSEKDSTAVKGKAGKQKGAKGEKKKENVDEKKKAKEAPQVVSRIAGAREVKVKPAKSTPLNRLLQPWQQPVDTTKIKYIVDPNLDCAETEERLPVRQFRKLMKEHEQLTSRWLGITGDDHMPSVGEWEIYIAESSAFIFHGLERLLSYLPPAKISALSIPDCMLVYVLDLAQTSKSFMRQSRLDVFKSEDDQVLERPLETAMLVSLTGTRCIMMNQWYCPLAENSDKLELTMKDLLEKGRTTGQTMRLLFSPRKRREEEIREKESLTSPQVSPRASPAADVTGKQKKDSGSAGKKEKKLGKKGTSSKNSQGDEKPVEVTVFEEVDPDKDREEPKDDEFSLLQRSWFNMVCYGMPNLIIS